MRHPVSTGHSLGGGFLDRAGIGAVREVC
jgi:hypothetical protein